jgi:branched-chain amino acid transport system substrate-binding protein
MNAQLHTFDPRRLLGLLLTVGLVGAGATLAHASFQTPSAPLLTQKVRVGLLVPLTGAAAAEGEAVLHGATLAVEQVNAQGGVSVTDRGGRMLMELVVGDTRTAPEDGVAAAKMITAAGVDVVTGGYSSPVTLADQEVIAASKTPFLIAGASTPQVTRRTDIDTSGMFHYCVIGPHSGKAIAQFLAEAIRPRVAPDRPLRVALLYQDTPFGQSFREGLPGLGIVGWARAQQLPLEFVAEEKFPLGAVEFAPQLMAIQAARPDVIVPVALAEETIAILRQGIRVLGIQSLWGPADMTVETPRSIQALGELNDMLTIATYFTPYDTPRGATGDPARQFRAAFETRWGEAPSAIAANHYDAIFILKRAIEDAGSLEKARVSKALERVDMPALTLPVEGGRIRFDEHHEVRFELFVTQLTRDAASGQTRAQVIWPAAVANAALRLPSR